MAYSTPKTISRLCVAAVISGGLILTLLAGGCQRTGTAPVALTNPTPIVTDEAMAQRDWEATRALYANGHVKAWPTLFPYQPSDRNPEYVNAMLDPVLLVGQTAALPVTAIMTPPWTPVMYHGVYLRPTYTADVPLEPIR